MEKKNASITETLQRAKREKDAFDVDMKAAKAERDRFREMVETRADMDDNFKVRRHTHVVVFSLFCVGRLHAR